MNVHYPWYEALWKGVQSTYNGLMVICTAFGQMIVSLVSGGGMPGEVAGPIGIAHLTKQVAEIGLVPFLNFMALLSLNLAVINVLPIPALDGGRILFVLIELVKGSPVSRTFEQRAHTIGFSALLLLMFAVTIRYIDVGYC